MRPESKLWAGKALILGRAVPMPVVVRTRDTTSAAYYEALGYAEGDQLQKKLEKNRKALGRDDSGLYPWFILATLPWR